jgi:kynurenine formamidase
MNVQDVNNWLIKGAQIRDLTLTIDPSRSYYHFPAKEVYNREEIPVIIEPLTTHKAGPFRNKIQMSTQDFTHLDVPKHFFKDGLANHEVPLIQLLGEAVVIDLSHKKPGEMVTAKDLEESGMEVNRGDIVIIRTDWTDRAFGTRRFWAEIIGLSLDAGDWLLEKDIKALATDFYTDPPPVKVCETCGKFVKRDRPEIRNHHKLLKRGILLIDFVTNLKSLEKKRVLLICLPIKLKGTDGGPARVIAIE